jgi:transposase
MLEKIRINPIRIGALPILRHFEKKVGIIGLFEKHLISDTRDKIAVHQTLGMIFYNVALERFPLYKMGQWSVERNLVDPMLANCCNDDRIGRALDRLFLADRATLLTEIVLKAIQVFSINTDRLHNDSTTVPLTGDYENDKNSTAAKPKRGHSKDHRPDLKQLLYSLTVSADGAIPLYFKVWDGNSTDDQTHIRNWMSLRGLLSRVDFIYVADSKLCTRENMDFINGEGGFFITVLPQTRSEDKQFKDWIQIHPPQWQEVLRIRNLRHKYAPQNVYWVFESPIPSSEGYRIIWIKSSQKQKIDSDKRTSSLEKTVRDLTDLSERQFRNRDKLKNTIDDILRTYGTQAWFHYQIQERKQELFRQENKGRPSKDTLYTKKEKSYYFFTWTHNQEAIRYSANCDGIFPLITNRKDESSEILKFYKFQPRLEKRHEQFKTVYQVAPLFIKNPVRIEALLFIYFLVMLVTSLIERYVRHRMSNQKISSIPLYPEQRECKNPTADKVLDLFRDVRLNTIMIGNSSQIIADELTDLQKTVLDLLDIKHSEFFENQN